MNELRLLRAIWEIRYPAAASFFDNRGKIATRWYQRNGFDNWNIAQNQLRLHSKEDRQVFSIDHRRMFYVEDIDDVHSFLSKASQVTAWTLMTLKVRRVERIGFRVFIVSERESFDKLRDTMMRRIFAFDEHDWNVFGGKPLDIALPLTLSVGESMANFKIGPVTREELARELEIKDERQDILPASAVLIDFDVFQKDPTFTSMNMKSEFFSFLKESWRQIESISDSIMSHFGGFLDD